MPAAAKPATIAKTVDPGRTPDRGGRREPTLHGPSGENSPARCWPGSTVHGRKHLPRQQQITALSRLDLRDHVATDAGGHGHPHYERFMQRFPDAQSPGRRGRTMKRCICGPAWVITPGHAICRKAARTIVTEHAGEFPETLLEAVQALPGIGRSTAGAILAISKASQATSHPRRQRQAVLTRCFGIEGFPGETGGRT